MTHTALTALACALLTASALASTGPQSSAGPARASSHANAQKPGTWIQAPMKKGGSGVSVRWRMAAAPKVGEPVALTIELGGLRSPEGARVEVKGENVTLARATGMQALKAGPPQQQQVSFTPTAEGVYFINVFTEQAGRVSAVSLPVQVGKAGVKLEKPGQTTTLPNRERAVIMQSS
jgi:hypothetical protein